ncbi:hypothetical protein DUNSADRAFT_17396 [Dunaliella salina]|uniref:Encoded protein n=1 Tax=Dunaliella salina TaxID=3046 RepID=A0ABQ7G1T7_DUNSA|nr:hypothetical protein DUNSADRAFT_17396 [Dunaliella salina]|eukprot:KAF5828572.1 hypothetical protein DUNSADRAFT_17396 [Dunaliella salina]
MRAMVICKSPTTHIRPNGTFTRALRGHVVALPNPPGGALSACFPQPLDSITEIIQLTTACKKLLCLFPPTHAVLRLTMFFLHTLFILRCFVL